MALNTDTMIDRLLAMNADNKTATVWLISGAQFGSDNWTANSDGTLSCEVDGIETYFDPAKILAVRETA